MLSDKCECSRTLTIVVLFAARSLARGCGGRARPAVRPVPAVRGAAEAADGGAPHTGQAVLCYSYTITLAPPHRSGSALCYYYTITLAQHTGQAVLFVTVTP